MILDLEEDGAPIWMIELMYRGVRIGGGSSWGKSYSWGFGGKKS